MEGGPGQPGATGLTEMPAAGTNTGVRPDPTYVRAYPANRFSPFGRQRRRRISLFAGLLLAIGLSGSVGRAFALTERPSQSSPRRSFDVVEATVAQIHAAMHARRLTCVQLVDAYLARIAEYDRHGPMINAVVSINPAARDLAAELDRHFAASGFAGPLHCVPTILKENFESIGLQSSAGSKALEGFVSDRDAFVVARLKAAGAIVLATSNMAELGLSPHETLSSTRGVTRNPYALDRVTAGSSGGTAAAVAASFGAVGLGSDTGNSIRGPAAHTALVGIRPTWGLASRAGLIPVRYLADVPGPMTRTVADAARVLQAIVGEDPEDPVTARARGRTLPDYSASLWRGKQQRVRVGILGQAYDSESVDREVFLVFQKAIDDMQAACADVADELSIGHVERPHISLRCRGFRYDIDAYLGERGRLAPVRSLAEIFSSGLIGPWVRHRVKHALKAPLHGPDSESCAAKMAFREAFAAAIDRAMDENGLDALVYPTWSDPPRLIGDLRSPHGDNSQLFAPSSGFPAINVPMGYTRSGRLPAGLTLLGRAWDEATLISIASCYEQATRHRRPPLSTPPLD